VDLGEIKKMRGIMSALMQGALPEAYEALENLSPYVSSEYIDELAEMFGSFSRNGEEYTLKSFVDEYGSWTIAPLSRAIYEVLNDNEIEGAVGHALAMHKAFPDIMGAISSVKEVFILESIGAFNDIDLLYIHYKFMFYIGRLDCNSLEYIIAADGDSGAQAVQYGLSLLEEDLMCCLNSCNSFKQLNLDFEHSVCADVNVSQCFYQPMQDGYMHCYQGNIGAFCP
jgi:hypothetical protein